MLQTLGVDHVSAVRGALQPAHGASGGPGLRGAARDPHLSAQHRDAPPHQRRQEAQGLPLRVNRPDPKPLPILQCTRPRRLLYS